MDVQTSGEKPYPVQFSVEYPDRELNRVTSAFRIFWVIPILIVLGTLTAGVGTHAGAIAAGGGGVLFFPTLLMIVFRQKYPRWWFDFNLELMRFSSRVGVYFSLMDDRYPSTDEQQSVTLDFPYPDAERDLNRWLPLVKWFLAIPHYVVLAVLIVASLFVGIYVWFAVIFTGRYPRGAFDFVLGVMRWENRVAAYAFALVTDEYPPFRLSP
jgi:hypothetical protein